jgi:hypothetical protein
MGHSGPLERSIHAAVIAVHRKVILDEAASRGLLATLARPRGRRYFMAAFLIAMPYAAAQIVLGVLGLAIRNFDGTAMLLSFLATITGFIFGIRLAPALPAIAVDKPGPWAAGGLALSDGSAWRIFWILLLTMVVVCIPAGAAGLLATYVFDLRWTLSVTMSGPRLILLETISSPTYLAIFPVYCLWYALVIAAWASALSHIYIAVTSGPVPPNEA